MALASRRPSLAPVAFTVVLATALWFVAFFLTWGNFWLKISLSAALLAACGLYFTPDRREFFRFDARALLIGLASAAALYLIFWVARLIALQIFSFAGDQIGGIYGRGLGTPVWVIALLLFFVTGPAEEIFWRGFLQRRLMERFGGATGWVLATAIYTGVHLWTLNLMLVGAAAVAGAFWGLLYWRLGNLAPVIVSHALWSSVIFAVLPMS